MPSFLFPLRNKLRKHSVTATQSDFHPSALPPSSQHSQTNTTIENYYGIEEYMSESYLPIENVSSISGQDSSKVAKIQFDELQSFLGENIVNDPLNARTSAEKLVGLTAVQFKELSTDVYDELVRRNNTALTEGINCLPARDEFHLKRNQARKQLATLPKTPFKDLSRDILFDLRRRYPEIEESEGSTGGLLNQTPSTRSKTPDSMTKNSAPPYISTDLHQSLPPSPMEKSLVSMTSLPFTELDAQMSFSPTSHFCLDGQIERVGTHPAASGGFADVWKGSMGTLPVAIKVMRPFESNGGRIHQSKLFKRLWREFLNWSCLSHPNVIICLGFSYNFSSEPDIPSLISPWMSNGTVLSYIAKYKDISSGLKLLVGIAEGLSYLHNRNPVIVHGDLRAGNVLVSDNGIPCLCDFGLSRILSETRGMTTSSEISGSLRWMSPELIRGATVSVNSDVWAYGMTALEILSGNRPYHDIKLDVVVFGQILSGQPPSPPENLSHILRDQIWAICQQCWEPKATERPSMNAVTSQITAVQFKEGSVN